MANNDIRLRFQLRLCTGRRLRLCSASPQLQSQKIVIEVQMKCGKCRSKATSLVAATGGVDSVAIAGDAKDQVVVVGDNVDSVKLTSALRNKVGPAHLVQVADAAKEKEKEPAVVEYPFYYNYPAPQPMSFVYANPPASHAYGYGYQSRPDSTCSIM